jgi:hypothetical protein
VQAVRSIQAYEPPTERYRKGQHVVYQMAQSRVYLESDLIWFGGAASAV